MSQDELNKSKVPDPDAVPRAKRRRFNAEYKLRILEEADDCSEPDDEYARQHHPWHVCFEFSVGSSSKD